MPSNTEMLDLFEQTVSSIDEVCSLLADEEWDLPTDLPGWTVKDNLSHVAHYESTAVGRPSPDDVDISQYKHVINDFQAGNERGVEYRRARPGPEILHEFRQAATERIKLLRNLDEDSWETTFMLPIGEVRQDQALPIRVLDLYFHEQDIRRGAGKPGHLNGAVARFVCERFRNSMGYVVGKKAEAPEGARVRFEIGPPGRPFDIVMADGRGTPVESDGEPDVTFTGDAEAFFCVVGGRWTPENAVATGRWSARGDADLIERIHANITVLP